MESPNQGCDRDVGRDLRRPQGLIGIEPEGAACRVANDVVGQDARRGAEGAVLFTPLGAGLQGAEPAPPRFLPMARSTSPLGAGNRTGVKLKTHAAPGRSTGSSTKKSTVLLLRLPSRRAFRRRLPLSASNICPKSGALITAGSCKLPSSAHWLGKTVTGVTPGSKGKTTSTASTRLVSGPCREKVIVRESDAGLEFQSSEAFDVIDNRYIVDFAGAGS